MSKTVQKMSISQEEQAVVNNIMALLQELLAMGGDEKPMAVEAMTGEAMMENKMAKEPMPEVPPENEAEIDKSLVETPSEGSTANDDAGVRDEENNTNITDENVSVLAKAILAMANKNQPKQAQKSVVTNNGNIQLVNALNEMAKTMKTLVEKQNTQENVIEKILEGLGVAKALEENPQAKVIQKDNKPIRSNEEALALIELIQKSVGEKKEEVQPYGLVNQNEVARKSIAGWLGKVITNDR